MSPLKFPATSKTEVSSQKSAARNPASSLRPPAFDDVMRRALAGPRTRGVTHLSQLTEGSEIHVEDGEWKREEDKEGKPPSAILRPSSPDSETAALAAYQPVPPLPTELGTRNSELGTGPTDAGGSAAVKSATIQVNAGADAATTKLSGEAGDSPTQSAQTEGSITLTVSPTTKSAASEARSPEPEPGNPNSDLQLPTSDFEPMNSVGEVESELPTATGAPELEIGNSELGTGKTRENRDGISAAQQMPEMKKTVKANEVAQRDEQILPAAPPEADGKATPAPLARPVRLATLEWSSHQPITNDAPPLRAEPISVSTILPAAPAVQLGPTLERTQEMVSAHALRLRQSDDGSLQVIIRPADGVQLSLDLRRVAEGVEVRAELNQGDFNFLNRHWSELQEQLENHGIRLSELGAQNGGLGTGDGNANYRNAKLGIRDSELAARPATGSLKSAVRTPRPGLRTLTAGCGWEYWA